MKREEPEPPGYQGSPFNHSLLDFSRKVSEISFLLRAVAQGIKEVKETLYGQGIKLNKECQRFFILSLVWCVQQILQTYRTGYPSCGPKKVETMAIDINEAIAVVGLDLKFPGDAASPESFYEMLLRGRSALSEIPSDRFNLD